MFEKYLVIKENKILCGQNATTGTWYCKELPADSTQELDNLINDINKILNKYNKKEKNTPATPKKEKNENTMVKM